MEDEKKLINQMESDLNETLYHIDNGFVRETAEYLIKSGYKRTNHALVPLDTIEVRKWWRFDNNQQPMSSYHDREEFIKKFGLPAQKSVEEIIEVLRPIYMKETDVLPKYAQSVHRLVYGEKK